MCIYYCCYLSISTTVCPVVYHNHILKFFLLHCLKKSLWNQYAIYTFSHLIIDRAGQWLACGLCLKVQSVMQTFVWSDLLYRYLWGQVPTWPWPRCSWFSTMDRPSYQHNSLFIATSNCHWERLCHKESSFNVCEREKTLWMCDFIGKWSYCCSTDSERWSVKVSTLKMKVASDQLLMLFHFWNISTLGRFWYSKYKIGSNIKYSGKVVW